VTVQRVDETAIPSGRRALATLRYLLTTVQPVWADQLRAVHDERPIDAIHVHDLPLVATGHRVAEDIGAAVVADLHENYPEALRQWRRMYDLQTVVRNKKVLAEHLLRPVRRYERIERRCVQRADRVLTPCREGGRHYVDDCGAEPDSVAVVGNTVDRTHYDTDAEAMPGYDEFTVGYVGKYAPHRGLESVVEAFADVRDAIPEARLLVVGAPGGEAYGRRFDRFVERVGVRDAVTFTGWVDFEEVPRYVAASDVCLVPHARTPHTETTIPHKLFQYMASATPVLVSDVQPLERVVSETDAGLVATADDPESFAEALVRLGEDSRLRTRLGANGRRAVESEWNWERDARRLVETYASLV
jgi:glycosyltransferase involved in cell wall biosynthesis